MMRRATLLLAAALAFACGKLTIDVDVYTGPLANEANVQVQQAAVMAIGAKPLLIELRNKLEEAENPAFSPETAVGYIEGYMPQGGSPEDESHGATYQFRDRNALRANAVLSLYDDRGEPLLAGYTREAYRIGTQLTSAGRVLKPEDPEPRRKLWESLEQDARPIPGQNAAA